MSGDGSVGMQNVYCNAKYRGKAKSFPSIQGKNKKSWKHLELGFFLFFLVFWKLDSWFAGCGFVWFLEVILCFLDFTCWRSWIWNSDFSHLLFSPSSITKEAPNRGGRKGLKLLHGRSLIVPTGSFRGSFSKKCCGRHRIGANTSKGPRMTRSLLQIEI